MQIYPSLFAYLNGKAVENYGVLRVCDRPIILANEAKNFTCKEAIALGGGLYEIAFPYLEISDLEHHQNELKYGLTLEPTAVAIQIADEVCDRDNFEDENQSKIWGEKLGDRFDDSVAKCLPVFTGLIENLISEKLGKTATVRVLDLPDKDAKIKDAQKPLIITLQNRYELNKKLQTISPKMRQQLRRRAELTPIGRIQEMDAYCLRDYTRRPGRNAAEKGGSRQELMAVRRHQDYNTPENRLLIYFVGKILYLESIRLGSEYAEENRSFSQSIKAFRNQPHVRQILRQLRRFQLLKPNYVLLQHPIYNSFYRAYLDYLAKRKEKQKIWGFRNRLFADVISLCLLMALTKFENFYVNPTAELRRQMVPETGRYLIAENEVNLKIQVFVKDKVYNFTIEKPEDIGWGDWLLNLEIHDLNSDRLETRQIKIPIWVFWYRPTDAVILQAVEYLGNQQQREPDIKTGLIFYLQVSPNKFSSQTLNQWNFENPRKVWLLQTPNFLAEDGGRETVNMISDFIKGLINQLTDDE